MVVFSNNIDEFTNAQFLISIDTVKIKIRFMVSVHGFCPSCLLAVC
jgi:hypothetical protein